MFMVSLRLKTLCLALLLVVLANPQASAANLRTSIPQWAQAAEDAPFFSHLLIALSNAWAKAGCYVVPRDHCTNPPAQSPPLQAKEGCRIDPDGRCLA
jgi:ABC-type sugar transport system substrate-binding protein